MRRALAALLLLASCTPIAKTGEPIAERRIGPGVIESREAAEIANDEDMGNRVAIGLLAAGIPGAIAAGAMEKDYGTGRGWRYQVRLAANESIAVRTYSVLQPGDCVVIYDLGPGRQMVVERQAPAACGR